MAALRFGWRSDRGVRDIQKELIGPIPPTLRVGMIDPAAFDGPPTVHLRARFERSSLGTYTSLGNQDTFNEGVTRGSVWCAQERSYSRIRVPCRDRSIS